VEEERPTRKLYLIFSEGKSILLVNSLSCGDGAVRPLTTSRTLNTCVNAYFSFIRNDQFQEQNEAYCGDALGIIPWRVFCHSVFCSGFGRPLVRA
jgi:hypothetical protein